MASYSHIYRLRPNGKYRCLPQETPVYRYRLYRRHQLVAEDCSLYSLYHPWVSDSITYLWLHFRAMEILLGKRKAHATIPSFDKKVGLVV